MSDEPPTFRSVQEGPAETSIDPSEGGTLESPRRGWRRVLVLAVTVIVAVLVVGLAVVLGPELWMAAADESVRPVDGRLVGEAAGYVAGVDRELRTVAVSRSVFGWWPVVVTVNPDTVITVQSREGAFGDLAGDMLVRVTYEIVADTRMARSIEIGGPRVGLPSAVPPARAAPVPDEPPAPAPPASASRPAERKAAPAATPAPPPSPAPRVTAPVERVAPSRSPASDAPVVRAEPRPPRVPADAVPAAARRAESAESDSADGTAAIDWLINQRR